MAPDPGEVREHPWNGWFFIKAAAPDAATGMALNDLSRPVLDTLKVKGGDGWLVLPPGDYLLLDADRLNNVRAEQIREAHAMHKPYYSAADTACLRQWLYGPFGTTHITVGDTTHLDLLQHGRCPWQDTPCVQYMGPLPP